MEITLGQHYNIREKLTVILYTFILITMRPVAPVAQRYLVTL